MIEGLPKCPKCGAVNWEEERYGLIYQPITPRTDGEGFTLGKLSAPSYGVEDERIYCKGCLRQATPALEKAIRALIARKEER